MKTVHHPGLSEEKWRLLQPDKRFLNLISELVRGRNLLERGDSENGLRSIERALELADLTITVCLHEMSRGGLRELLRFREVLAGIYAALTEPETAHEKSPLGHGRPQEMLRKLIPVVASLHAPVANMALTF
ncbi:MAG: hypothetical protein HQL31_05695 [Planctomycetes bacterium]|nr:hypothetical protein [Planctomycetota bacterium]